jgi:hypothetical protein
MNANVTAVPQPTIGHGRNARPQVSGSVPTGVSAATCACRGSLSADLIGFCCHKRPVHAQSLTDCFRDQQRHASAGRHRACPRAPMAILPTDGEQPSPGHVAIRIVRRERVPSAGRAWTALHGCVNGEARQSPESERGGNRLTGQRVGRKRKGKDMIALG